MCSEKPICAPPCLSEVFPASPNVCSSWEKYSSELNLTEGKGIVGYRHTQFTLSLSCTISRYVQVKFLLRMNIYIYRYIYTLKTDTHTHQKEEKSNNHTKEEEARTQ